MERTCAKESSKDGCTLTETGRVNHIEECTCSGNLCNDKSLSDTFPNHIDHIDCMHCASTTQSWCKEDNFDSHQKDVGALKSCHSARCETVLEGIVLINTIESQTFKIIIHLSIIKNFYILSHHVPSI